MTARLADHLNDSASDGATPIGVADCGSNLQRGLACYNNAEYEQAIGWFTAALRIDPTHAPLYTLRGQAHRFLCDYEKALADFHAAIRFLPSDPVLYTSRAAVLRLLGDPDGALADCDTALKL